MGYFFDSSAIIEIIHRNVKYEKFFEQIIITNSLHLGEVYYYFLREHNKQTADFWMRKLTVELIDVSEVITTEASLFKFEHKKIPFSYVDCVGYISALKNGLIFITMDKDFNNFHSTEVVI